MKIVAAIVIAALVLVGCRDSSDSMADQGVKGSPQEMPTSVGITAGQSGTGVTSGGSTGY